MIAIEAYDADLGMTILYSFLVGIPAPILAGPVFGKFIGKRIRTEPPEELAEQFSSKAERGLPGFGITLFTILSPVILMLIGSAADIIDPESTSFISVFCKFIGHEIIALLILRSSPSSRLDSPAALTNMICPASPANVSLHRYDHSDHRRRRRFQAGSDQQRRRQCHRRNCNRCKYQRDPVCVACRGTHSDRNRFCNRSHDNRRRNRCSCARDDARRQR